MLFYAMMMEMIVVRSSLHTFSCSKFRTQCNNIALYGTSIKPHLAQKCLSCSKVNCVSLNIDLVANLGVFTCSLSLILEHHWTDFSFSIFFYISSVAIVLDFIQTVWIFDS